MTKSSDRVGIFSSNRGRAARTVLITAGVAALIMFFGRGMTADPDQTSAENQSTLTVTTEEKVPNIAAPQARPFAALTDEGPSEGEDQEEVEGALRETPHYQEAVQDVQAFVAAYGTYDSAGSPEDWVEGLPAMSDEFAESVSLAAQDQWPALADRSASAETTPEAESIRPVTSSAGGETLVLSIKTSQESSYEGKSSYASRTFLVTVVRMGDKWVVDGVR